MTSTAFFFVLLIAFASATRHLHSEPTAIGASSDLSSNLLDELELAIAKSRGRRAPAPGPARVCGRKLMLFILATCGDSCDAREPRDIATYCCGEQCSEEQIKEWCCPGRM